MKEKSFVSSTPEVKAILEGRKTMTRLVIKPQPEIDTRYEMAVIEDGKLKICGRGIGDICETRRIYKMPYHVGDILWVRETYGLFNDEDEYIYIYYKADEGNPEKCPYFGKWKPSIHMPREVARIFLEVKSVLVERLRDISEKDAKAEGVILGAKYGKLYSLKQSYKASFSCLWNNINAKRGYSWDSNPWVWVIEFERVEGKQ